MANPIYGRIASVAPGAAANTLLYAVSAGRLAKGKVRICNRSTSASDVIRLYHVDAADVSTIGNDDYGLLRTLAPLETIEVDNEVVTGGNCLGAYSTGGISTFSFIGVVQDQ